MFSEDKTEVALIRKQKPEWQKGKLNGIGGKCEIGEYDNFAMVREFKEETGNETSRDQWDLFCIMRGKNIDDEEFEVVCFFTTGDLSKLKTMETEVVEIHKLQDINPLRNDMIENLCWLISLALDGLQDGRPSYTRVEYFK